MINSRLKISSDVFLTPAEFAARYTTVFPDAELTPMYRTIAMHCRAEP